MNWALIAGIVIALIGLGVAGRALLQIQRLDPEASAELLGPRVYPFVTGVAVFIIGLAVVLGQLIFGRLLA